MGTYSMTDLANVRLCFLPFRLNCHCGREELRVLTPASSDVPRDSGAKLQNRRTNKQNRQIHHTSATQNSQRQRSELESWPVNKPLLENYFMVNFHFGYFGQTASGLQAKNIQILFALCKMILPKSMARIFLLFLTFRHFSLESHRCFNVCQSDLDVWYHEQFNNRFWDKVPFSFSFKFDIIKWFYISADRYLPKRDHK